MTPPTATARRPAFTLIELMIVVFIIALLTGLTLTIVPRVRKAVATSASLNQMQIIANAMQQYYGDYHAYPGPLANNQLGSFYAPGSTNVSLAHVGAPGGPGQLVGTDGTGGGVTNYPAPATALGGQLAYITEAENCLLGLCGGLRLTVSTAGTVAFEYHPEDLFPDGVSPAYTGARSLSLNTALARKSQAYLSLKAGDISAPSTVNHGLFTDAGGRHANDSLIPEFLDKYSNQMPILIMRANVGGKAVCGIRNGDGAAYFDDQGALPIPVGYGNAVVVPQWDLNQISGYTQSTIGTVTNKQALATNGLMGTGPSTVIGTVLDPTTKAPANSGKNAIAYLRDPNYTVAATGTTEFNVGATARQADQFLLISAGPDGIYGTPDDVIYPGN